MSPLIATHAFAALVGLVVGLWQLFLGPRGTTGHRVAGRIWVVALLYVAITSFWITEIRPGHFSALHILSVVTLVTVPIGLWNARRGDIIGHRAAMTGNWLGLVGAGIAASAIPHRDIPQLVVHDTLSAVVGVVCVALTSVVVIGLGRAVDAANPAQRVSG